MSSAQLEAQTVGVAADKPSSALATIDTLVPEKVFAPGGVKAIVSALKEEVRTQAASLDVSSEKGRKQIASLAYKVAQSKTALDKMGKDLTEEWQRQTSLVNKDRRYLRDDLDALKDEVRKPLDDYLAQEAARVAAHEAALAEIEILASVDGRSAEEINVRIWKVPSIDDRQWQEFRTRADHVIAVTLERLVAAQAVAAQREEEGAEAERKRHAEADRIAAENEAKRIHREEEIAANARAVVIMEAEQEAERVRQAAVKTLAEAQERERLAQERAQALADEAEAARVKGHQDALGAMRDLGASTGALSAVGVIDACVDRLKEIYRRQWGEFALAADAVYAATKEELTDQRQRSVAATAKQEADEAAERERTVERARQEATAAATLAEQQRVAAKEAADRFEADRRAANVAHQRKVNREAVADLMTLGLTEEQGKTVVAALAKGAVKHCTIQY